MTLYKQSKLSEIVTKIFVLFKDLFCRPICINACLHYSYGRLRHRNWGDDINIYFLERLWKRNISYLFASSLSSRQHKENYIVIGSTLTMLANSDSIVWGAGIIDENKPLTSVPKKILAVRGPKTRQWLLDRGIDCPLVYGDPALLIPKIYSPQKLQQHYKLGIIPHYDDYDCPLLDNLKADNEVLFIRMEGYDKWTDVLDQIVSCDYIASSSLHGLIMAEAYGISNLWISVTDKLLGGHFKFHDFFLSIGNDRPFPFPINKDTTKEEILVTKNDYVKGKIDLTPLLSTSPFKTYL